MRIEQINEIKTQYNDELQKYTIVLNKDYKLSILTGSHYDSSECGALEIALLKNDKWAFGALENIESAIIDYISMEEADKMVSEMKSGNIEEVFLKYKYGNIS